MIVNVALTLQDADDKSMTSNEAAEAILKALGADETKDTVTVTIFIESLAGSAGVPPEPQIPT